MFVDGFCIRLSRLSLRKVHPLTFGVIVALILSLYSPAES